MNSKTAVDTAAAQPSDKDIQAWGDRNAIKQGLDELRVMVDDARSLAPSVVADLGQWATSRFGVFESDGSFRELPERGWESDPLAHTSRWVGGINDAQLLRAALAATPVAQPSAEPAPEAVCGDHAQLMRFYDVATLEALADAQSHHIERLQAKLPKLAPAFTRTPREG